MPKTTIYISEETFEIIRALGINLSGFVNSEIPLKFSNIDEIELKIKQKREELEKLENQYNFMSKGFNKQINLADQKTIKTLIEMNKIVENDPTLFNGVLKRFRNEFKIVIDPNSFIDVLKQVSGLKPNKSNIINQK